ncbi:putative invertase inhibitor [Aegilops tauschii subsp. strangulata]|uniref:putative invertase inhibitor n=1 Tax=Aegilops tauschii subsp. strangulata TaxID=200361 RepID=UPI00098A10CD|nr:putative invertase inhibitor [Aegilops tauschii subsp. strangulata]
MSCNAALLLPAMVEKIVLLLLLAAPHGLAVAVSPTPIINTTCAALAHNPNFTLHVEYEFCVRSLSADPMASSATDARGLAAAAASLTVANITSTELIIADLVKNLGSCLSDYKEIKDTVQRGLDDICGGRAADASKKFLDAAESDVPSLCDLILIEGVAKRNPIDKENQNAYFLSVMASDITQLMLDSHA